MPWNGARRTTYQSRHAYKDPALEVPVHQLDEDPSPLLGLQTFSSVPSPE